MSIEPTTKIHSNPLITDEFMEWEERDSATISFFKHCVAGKLRKKVTGVERTSIFKISYRAVNGGQSSRLCPGRIYQNF